MNALVTVTWPNGRRQLGRVVDYDPEYNWYRVATWWRPWDEPWRAIEIMSWLPTSVLTLRVASPLAAASA
jgi:hypothetical protein